MDKTIYSLYNWTKNTWCDSCASDECRECAISTMLSNIKSLEISTQEASSGCDYCMDSRNKQSKELFFFDAANNFRQCDYCPKCGRKY